MDETPPAAEFDASEAAEARPVLEYDTPETHSAAAVVRGVGLLLLATGGIGFVTEGISAVGTAVNGGYSPEWFTAYVLVDTGVGCLVYLLYGISGLLCLRRNPAAIKTVCVGAVVELLVTLLLRPSYRYFSWRSGIFSAGGSTSLGEFAGFGYQVLRMLPATLLPLLLLWLFTRPLIRGAIGVK